MERTKTESSTLDIPSSRELLEGLLTIPGSTGDTYSRFHRYSPRNLGFLALQGCPPEAVATYKKWTALGRQVVKGSKALSILRPIQVKIEKDGEETLLVRRFKVVRALFPLSMTEGDDLPPYEHPEWKVDRALATLGIRQVAFEGYDANVGGYARDRGIAINPVARFPLRTTLHEISHIEHGHTTPDGLREYQMHRGSMEFEAEASAYVALNELGELDDTTASVSRGYVQSWLKGEKPPESSLRQVLNVSTRVLEAGYERLEELST
jgi:hypothetical protein